MYRILTYAPLKMQGRDYRTLSNMYNKPNAKPNHNVAQILDLECEVKWAFIDVGVIREEDRPVNIFEAYPCFKDVRNVCFILLLFFKLPSCELMRSHLSSEFQCIASGWITAHNVVLLAHIRWQQQQIHWGSERKMGRLLCQGAVLWRVEESSKTTFPFQQPLW